MLLFLYANITEHKILAPKKFWLWKRKENLFIWKLTYDGSLREVSDFHQENIKNLMLIICDPKTPILQSDHKNFSVRQA